MEHSHAHEAQQLSLLDIGETLTEVAVSALTTEPELRDIGRALITLTRYHASREGNQQ